MFFFQYISILILCLLFVVLIHGLIIDFWDIGKYHFKSISELR